MNPPSEYKNEESKSICNFLFVKVGCWEFFCLHFVVCGNTFPTTKHIFSIFINNYMYFSMFDLLQNQCVLLVWLHT